MPRDKTPITPETAKITNLVQAREIVKRADRAISTRPHAEATALIRDMRGAMLALIGEVEAAP